MEISWISNQPLIFWSQLCWNKNIQLKPSFLAFKKDELKSHDRHQRHLKSTTEVWLFSSRFFVVGCSQKKKDDLNVYECKVFRLVGTSCMSIIFSM